MPQSGGVLPVLPFFQEKQQRGDSAEQKEEARLAAFLFAIAERMSFVFPGEGEFRRRRLPTVLRLQIGEKVFGALRRRIYGRRQYREGKRSPSRAGVSRSVTVSVSSAGPVSAALFTLP